MQATRHKQALMLLFQEVVETARSSPRFFAGSPGSVAVRSNAKGFAYYAHKYQDVSGAQKEIYLAGPKGDTDADAKADSLRTAIIERKELNRSIRLLGREGFALVDARAHAILASLARGDVFEAGALLVGSHAYGILLNHLGLRAVPYRTEDIDVVRHRRLTFDDGDGRDWKELLDSSGLVMTAVPSLNRKEPATSYKEKGRSQFQVDLLVPVRGDSYKAVAVPELGSHAQGLPHLGYLTEESMPAVALSRMGPTLVRVPVPERFAFHKLLVSQLRPPEDSKRRKDTEQAATLLADLHITHPGAIEDAAAALSKKARRLVKRALPALEEALGAGEDGPLEELANALG